MPASCEPVSVARMHNYNNNAVSTPDKIRNSPQPGQDSWSHFSRTHDDNDDDDVNGNDDDDGHDDNDDDDDVNAIDIDIASDIANAIDIAIAIVIANDIAITITITITYY